MPVDVNVDLGGWPQAVGAPNVPCIYSGGRTLPEQDAYDVPNPGGQPQVVGAPISKWNVWLTRFFVVIIKW